jgi:tetratricopeptide (TPR) repeat protein
VRITAQLVNAEDGYQMWSQRFDRELSDVFAIQDEIAATIVNELSSEFSGAAPDKSVPGNLEAYEAYLKGIYARNLWTEETMGRAIASFQEAVARDPGFAPAYAALAEGYVWLYSGIGILPAKDTVPEARRAVEKALLLDPRLAEAHKVRGLIAMNHDWDRIEAEKGLTRAIELSPSSAAAHLWNAWRLALLEAQYGQALVELEEAERLDPLDLQIKTQIGYVYYFLHDLDRAIGQFEKTLALEPSFAFAHYGLGDAYTQKGLYDQAIAEFKKAIELKGRSINTVSVLGYAQGRAGNVEEAKSLLAELTARSAGGYVPAIWIALVHLGLGDLENLFLWLERAFEEGDGSLILITSAIEFDPVREDPRFKSLLAKMGLGDLASRPR